MSRTKHLTPDQLVARAAAQIAYIEKNELPALEKALAACERDANALRPVDCAIIYRARITAQQNELTLWRRIYGENKIRAAPSSASVSGNERTVIE